MLRMLKLGLVLWLLARRNGVKERRSVVLKAANPSVDLSAAIIAFNVLSTREV